MTLSEMIDSIEYHAARAPASAGGYPVMVEVARMITVSEMWPRLKETGNVDAITFMYRLVDGLGCIEHQDWGCLCEFGNGLGGPAIFGGPSCEGDGDEDTHHRPLHHTFGRIVIDSMHFALDGVGSDWEMPRDERPRPPPYSVD